MVYLKILLVSMAILFNITQASEKRHLLEDNSPSATLLQEFKDMDPKEWNGEKVNEVLQQQPVTLSWGDILTIWGKNTLQLVNMFDCIKFLGIEPLPSCSRSSSIITQYFEDRVGYGISSLNFVVNWQPITNEGPEAMAIRGFCKKYNVEILREKLIDELSNERED